LKSRLKIDEAMLSARKWTTGIMFLMIFLAHMAMHVDGGLKNI